MGKKKEDVIIISEYLTNVDILSDFGTYAKKARESYYYLISLKKMLLEYDKNFLEKHKERLHIITDEFLNIDNKLCIDKKIENYPFNKKSNLEVAVSLEDKDDLAFMDHRELMNDLIKFIEIKSIMDELQINILNSLLRALKSKIEDLIIEIPELKTMNSIHNQEILFKTMLNHSHKENMIEAFEINSSNTKLKQECRSTGIKLPKIIKTNNYDYNLDKLRDLFNSEYAFWLTLLKEREGVIKERKLYKLNKKMFFLNIIVVILTLISTITAINTIIDWFK